MWSTVLILLVGVLLHPSWATVDVKYAGPVIFSFPCNENPRFLTQEFQIPANNRSAGPWKGIFYADQWPSSEYMKLDIVLDREAKIEVNPHAVHLIDLDGNSNSNSSATPEGNMKSFRLTTHPKPITRIEFKVQGVNGEFPSVLSIVANGIVLCDNNGRNSNADFIQSLSDGQSTTYGLIGAGKRRRGCGVRHPISSDTMGDLIDWPWRISLLAKETETNEWSVICGGTLIAVTRVLTAGSCIKSRKVQQIKVQIADRNVTVKEINLHAGFESPTLKDDLALLLLEEEGESEDEQRVPICIPVGLTTGDSYNNATIGTVTNQIFHEMRIENGIVCLERNRNEFGRYLSTKNTCVVISSPTSPSRAGVLPGDGLYEQIYDEDRKMFVWKIKGVASFTANAPFYIFTNLSKYYSFIGNSFVK